MQLDDDFPKLLDIFVSSDRETISAGQKWLDSVEEALKNAELLIVLCSKASVGRPWVNFEAGAVWLRGIPVIPVCHSGLKPHQLPVPLSMLEAIEPNRSEGQQKLYDAVGRLLGKKPPAVNFRDVAARFNELDIQLMHMQSEKDAVVNPHVLCAVSAPFAQPQYGFELDLEVLQRLFVRNVTVEQQLTSRRLRELLSSQQFDMLHLVLCVDPRNGDLIFSSVTDYISLENNSALYPLDRMSAKAFSALLVESQTKLVVLATCHALLLAVEVSHVANMAASDTEISGKDAAAWAECFYGFLTQGRSLFSAFELTRSQYELPIRAIRYKDFSIVVDAGSP